jgi:hypothetical protein
MQGSKKDTWYPSIIGWKNPTDLLDVLERI